jgi:acyl-CoA synthetase (AMP-forming)/AMP-acid ligase II/3-hydroxymyristoyl/3-hydroxydecanoyl-(acyl carrier protein) dehydratase
VTSRLLERHESSDLVAFGSGGEKTAADLLADAARVAAMLPPPTRASHVLLVFKSDRYAFATGLLGAWAAGHAVALPPNTRRDSVLAVLSRGDVVAMLHDTDAGRPIRLAPFVSGRTPGTALSAVSLPPRDAVATLFTSGTQSVMNPCPKSEAQLLAEACVLAEAFGFEIGSRLVATVQPSHIYGLLFSVLAPLVSGGAFIRETPFHAEAIAAKVQEHGARTLVTVPAHLRGLCTVDGGALSSLARVFSSTAPLRTETAAEFSSVHQTAVTEILGSTETGGIGWRHSVRSCAWQPLPRVEVEVDEDGCMWVKSPFVAGHGAVRTADLAKPHPDGGFLHLGRSDRTVKIAGRRVSLPAMERWLCRLDGVDDAALVAVPIDGARDVALLAAVVAPAWSVPRLREAMSSHFDLSVLPRRILLTEGLPREENGKLQRSRLLQIFGFNAEGTVVRWEVDWGERIETVNDGRVCKRIQLHIPRTFGAFEGHFPGYPILPAASQLNDLVLPCIRAERPDLEQVRSVQKLKFLCRIVPEDDLDLEIAWKEGEQTVDFSLFRRDKICSGGRIVFAERQT